jgi:hypothetical protein
MEALGCPLKG